MLESILTQTGSTEISIMGFLGCTAASLVLGLAIAFIYMFKNTYSKGFVITLVLLPSMVQLVIMLVNGNLGAGVAIMGAFSLVRFRSAPGSAREISGIFLAMATGLATGMGYIGAAALFVAAMGAAAFVLCSTGFGEQKSALRLLKVVIPENLNYTGAFDGVLAKYTSRADFLRVRTTSLGSLFELSWNIALKNDAQEKEFIDALRCLNGNLDIVCGRIPTDKGEL